MGRPRSPVMRKSGDRPVEVDAQLSREELKMRYTSLPAWWLIFSACLSAAQIHGTVTDPAGAPVAGAQVSVVSRLGVEAQTSTAANGAFEVDARDVPDARVV